MESIAIIYVAWIFHGSESHKVASKGGCCCFFIVHSVQFLTVKTHADIMTPVHVNSLSVLNGNRHSGSQHGSRELLYQSTDHDYDDHYYIQIRIAADVKLGLSSMARWHPIETQKKAGHFL